MSDGPGVFPVRLRVSDGTNPPVTSAVSLLTVTNAPPTGNLYIGTTGTVTAQTVDELKKLNLPSGVDITINV